MYQATRISEIKDYLRSRQGMVQGFVPTMGALHEGHLALVRRAREENNLVSCSIFINPIQFNSPDDLEKYPRTLEEDLKLLGDEGCDMAFVPSVEEMYPEPVTEKFDFGILETVMEGKYRPGHFNGVAIVVKRLFDIMKPGKAYFGEKDYQQLKVIQELVNRHNMPVNIIPCPTVREDDGLAISSRNRRLSKGERSVAPLIYLVLNEVNKQAGKTPVNDLVEWAVTQLSESGFVVEYFEIANSETLLPIQEWDPDLKTRAFTACYLGNIRLIDNIELIY
jgi:pantoate--beta-alanine ligase